MRSTRNASATSVEPRAKQMMDMNTNIQANISSAQKKRDEELSRISQKIEAAEKELKELYLVIGERLVSLNADVTSFGAVMKNKVDSAHQKLSQIEDLKKTLESTKERFSIQIQNILDTADQVKVGSTTVCSACGYENEAESRFCVMCGANLSETKEPNQIVCKSCGITNKTDSLFCSNCGNKLETAVQEEEITKKICVSCGADNDPDFAFCLICGQPLSSVEPVQALEDYKPKSTTCSHCGYENIDSVSLCVNCGSVLSTPTVSNSDYCMPIVTCSECGSKNISGSQFCINCGASLPFAENSSQPIDIEARASTEPGVEQHFEAKKPEGQSCPSCGSFNPLSSLFCTECGARLSESVFPTERSREEVQETAGSDGHEPNTPINPEYEDYINVDSNSETASTETNNSNLHKCPQCGAILEEDANFCMKCGQTMNRTEDLPEPKSSQIPIIEGIDQSAASANIGTAIDEKTFKKGNFLLGGDQQKFLDRNIPHCLVCGSDNPDWTLRFAKVSVITQFKCSKCESVYSALTADLRGKIGRSTVWNPGTSVTGIAKALQGKKMGGRYIRILAVNGDTDSDVTPGMELPIEEYVSLAEKKGREKHRS